MGQLAREAIGQDWPGIEALRDACYARWGMPVQERDGLHWLVYDGERRIISAVGYDEAGNDEWVILDWYSEEGRLGKRAGSAILKLLLSLADEQRKTIVGVSCFEPFIKTALKRGFKNVGVALARQPGGQGCHQH